MAEAVRVRSEEGKGASGEPFPALGPVNRLAEYPRRLRQFLREVRAEMKNVTWPTWSDVRATTAVVILTVFFFALFLFLVDYGFSHVVERVLKIFRP